MKKNVKLLSLLALGFVVAGAISLNVANTQGDVTAYSKLPEANGFIMDEGASVRIPDLENADVTTNDNGIRFTGLLGAELAESGVVEAGTFILPLNYWEKAGVISESTCFGDEAIYTWTGDEAAAEKTNAKTILHVEGTVYKEKASDAYYVIKGSALHIQGDNLAVDYIGCSYIKLSDGSYVFAETDASNARSVVEVAQKALLNAANDEAFLTETEVDDGNGGTTTATVVDQAVVTAVDNAYTKRWIDLESPTVEVTVQSTKPISSTESATMGDETISVPFTSYNCTTTADAAADDIEGYAYAKGETAAQTVMIDGSTVVTHKYNYTANRVTIFDGDTKPFDSETMTSYLEDHSGKAKSYDVIDADNTGWTYEGTGAIRFNGSVTHWDGIVWKNGVKLPFKTGTFTVALYVTDADGNAAAYAEWGAYMRYADAAGNKLNEQKVTAKDVNGNTITNLGKGFNLITLTLPDGATTDTVYELTLKIDPSRRLYVDNFCAENALYSKGLEVPEYYISSLAITTEGFGSTILFPEELVAASVQYKANGSDTWTTMTGENNTYAVSADTLATSYEFKAVCGETEISLGKSEKGFVWATFDEETPHYLMAEALTAYGVGSSVTETVRLYTSGANTGNCYSSPFYWGYVCHVDPATVTEGENGVKTGKIASQEFGFTATKISFYLYVEAGTQETDIGVFYMNGNGEVIKVKGKETAGVYKYTVDLTTHLDKLHCVCVYKEIHVDDIVFLA